MILLVLVLLPLLGAGGAVLAPRRATPALLASSTALVVVASLLSAEVVRHGPVRALGGLLVADATSAFMTLLIGLVALVAASQAGRAGAGQVRRFVALLGAFEATMLLAVLAANLGLLWVSIEATTVVTTFLVGHAATRRALEASWKYVIICSVGIALAFLGLVFLYLAARHAGGGSHALDWTRLGGVATRLDPRVTRLATALLMVGLGAKAGLVPLHSWLPDAHGEAPAPVSALMSGVLLAVALYGVIRVRAVADAALGPHFARGVLLALGVVTLLVATASLLGARDLKRLLAYSSMEHIGLMTLGVAAGGTAALSAVLVQMLGHGLIKPGLFLGAGEILHDEGTGDLSRLRGLLGRHRVLGAALLAGFAALIGLPPFSLFASELGMLRAEAQVGLGLVAAVSVAAIALAAVALARSLSAVFLGEPAGDPAPTRRGVAVTLGATLLASVALGLWMSPLTSLVHEAARVVA